MARLIDELRARGDLACPASVEARYRGAWARMAAHVMELVRDPALPVMEIDDVADYYYVGSSQEHWDLRRDFPGLVPPYPLFWVEHHLPQHMRSAECGSTDLSGLIGPDARLGVLVAGVDRDGATGRDIPAATRWILWCELVVDYDLEDHVIEGPHGSVFLPIDSEGTVLEPPSLQVFCTDPKEVIVSMLTWYHPTFLAISFLHCPGVRIVDGRLDFSGTLSPVGVAHLRAMLLSVKTQTARNT
jgi:hypothetical protein